jgi:type VI secretion system protein VasI
MNSVCLLVAVASLGFVATSAQAVTGEECASMPSDNNRLMCYDTIFKQEPAQAASAGSKWTVENSKSKMDDSDVFNISVTADKYGALLNIRCEEKVTTLYFTLGGTFMADIENYGRIRYRLDGEKTKSKSFVISTDNEALGLWSGGSSIPFAKQLLGHKKLTAEITGYNESASTVEFDLNGMDEQIAPLRKQCGW